LQREIIEERQDIVRYRYIITLEEVAEQTEKAIRDLSARIVVPGFRKGKAPLDLVRREVRAEDLLPQLNRHFIKIVADDVEKNLSGTGVIDYSFEEDFREEEDGTFSITMLFYRKPTVQLPDLKSIMVKKLRPSEKMLDYWHEHTVKRLREDYSTLAPKDTEAETGDKVAYHYQVYNSKGKQLFSGKEEIAYLIPENFNPLIEKMIGKKQGDSYSVDRTLTLRDKPDEPVTYTYQVQIKEVYRLIPPELNDAFARQVSEKFNTLEDLYQNLREKDMKYFDAIVEKNMKTQIENALTEMTKVDVSQETIQNKLDWYVEDLKKRGRYGDWEEDYSSEEEYRESLRDELRELMTLSWAIEKVAQEHNITITDEKAKEWLRSNSKSLDNNPEKLLAKYKKDKDFRDEIKLLLKNEEVMDFLLTQVTVEEEETTLDEDFNMLSEEYDEDDEGFLEGDSLANLEQPDEDEPWDEE